MKSINQSKSSVKTFRYLSNALIIGLTIFSETSFAANCATITASVYYGQSDIAECNCLDGSSTIVSRVSRFPTSGNVFLSRSTDSSQCTGVSDTTCTALTNPDNTTGTQYFKNTSAGATDYFKCDWTANAAANASFSNPATYVPNNNPPIAVPSGLNLSIQPEITTD